MPAGRPPKFSAALIELANARVEIGGERCQDVERSLGMHRGCLSRYRSGASRPTILADAKPLPNPAEIVMTPALVNLVMEEVARERALTGEEPAMASVARKLHLDVRGKTIRRIFRAALAMTDRIWSRVEKSSHTGHWMWRGKSIQRKVGSRVYPQVIPICTGPSGHGIVDVGRFIFEQCMKNGKPLPRGARITRCAIPNCVQPLHYAVKAKAK